MRTTAAIAARPGRDSIGRDRAGRDSIGRDGTGTGRQYGGAFPSVVAR